MTSPNCINETRTTPSTHKEPTFTINLSNTLLSSPQLALLNRGLTFIPRYRSTSLLDLYSTQDRLLRNLKLRDYFWDQPAIDNDRRPTFTNPSNWTPADRKISEPTLQTIDKIVNSTDTYLRRHRVINTPTGQRILLPYCRDNLTPDERRAITELRSNQTIIVKPADKGSATVVMDRSAYITEVYRQLNNEQYYRKLDRPIYTDNIPKINEILKEMVDCGHITSKQFAYLSAKPTDRQRFFYVLPKIHKDRDTWPQPERMPQGRPIVSDTGSESYRVAEYINYHLKPLSTIHPAYLKDTYDFVNKIRFQQIPHNALLVTGDVTSLYTNMNLDRILTVVQDILQEHPDINRPDEYILRLLDFTLRHNDFEFNGEFFLQTCGTAMGKSYAPSVANIYLRDFDKTATTRHLIKPLLYHRFLDDTFFIWTGTVQQLLDFQTFLNNIIPGITVTLNWSEEQIDFLDTTIYKEHGTDHDTLLTKVHFKPTDTHQLLHPASYHPRHTTAGILKSQLIRFRRLSSCRSDYDEACTALFNVLKFRHYSKRQMRHMKSTIWRQRSVNKASRSTTDILPIVVPFNDIGNDLSHQWRDIINDNGLFIDSKILNAYTVGKNLANLLVHSRLPPIATPIPHREQSTNQPVDGCNKCNGVHCRACNYITPTANFTSSHNKRTYRVHGNVNCRTTNVIYLITCRHCNLQYVGQTSRSLADRINDHLSYVRTRKTNTPTGLHFNLPGHNINDLQFVGIEHVPTDSSTLPIIERKWQQLLQTHYPHGINQVKEHLLSVQPSASGRARALSAFSFILT